MKKLHTGCHLRLFRFKLDVFDIVSFCEGLELLDAQSKTQDASCLPALKVSDIEPTIPVTPVQISTAGSALHIIVSQ